VTHGITKGSNGSCVVASIVALLASTEPKVALFGIGSGPKEAKYTLDHNLIFFISPVQPALLQVLRQ
jgi:hypothetical protein